MLGLEKVNKAKFVGIWSRSRQILLSSLRKCSATTGHVKKKLTQKIYLLTGPVCIKHKLKHIAKRFENSLLVLEEHAEM